MMFNRILTAEEYANLNSKQKQLYELWLKLQKLQKENDGK